MSIMNNWGDFAPNQNELPMEVIRHFAEVNHLPLTKQLEWFARDIWTECKHDQSLKEMKNEN